jgi:hypothetical protein
MFESAYLIIYAGTVVPPWKGPNIGTFLQTLGKFDLLEWMNKYWINQGAPNTDFWGLASLMFLF